MCPRQFPVAPGVKLNLRERYAGVGVNPAALMSSSSQQPGEPCPSGLGGRLCTASGRRNSADFTRVCISGRID